MIQQFAEWLSQTSLSMLIQTHNEWVIPMIQSIHIIAIGVVLTSVLMIDLRILGWAGHDQTLGEITDRFGPWLSWALVALLVTGISMVIGEPVRALLSFSFWMKMVLVHAGTIIQQKLVNRRSVKSLAIVKLLMWVGVVILGR